jgi:hypothetical protein
MNKPEDRFEHVISAVTTFLKVKQPENDLLFTAKLLVYALNTNHMDLICLVAKQISLDHVNQILMKKVARRS